MLIMGLCGVVLVDIGVLLDTLFELCLFVGVFLWLFGLFVFLLLVVCFVRLLGFGWIVGVFGYCCGRFTRT